MKNNFWTKFLESFSLFKYDGLSKKGLPESLRYFFLIFTIMAIACILISIKSFIGFPDMIRQELNKVDEFKIDITYNSTEPLYFPSKNPFLSIVNNETESKGKLTIYDEILIYKPIPFIQKNYELSGYKDIKENSKEIGIIIGALILLLLPSLLLYAYAYHILRYIIIALIFSLIARLVILVTGKRIKYKRLFCASLYSLTPLIIIEMLLLPFQLPLMYIPLTLYAIWYIIICIEIIEDF
jgi:hypothetical protein